MHAGTKEIAQLLLDAGADLEQGDRFGTTALMWTALRGNEPLVQLFLDAGAIVGIKNLVGETALSLALSGSHQAVADLLRQHGATQ